MILRDRLKIKFRNSIMNFERSSKSDSIQIYDKITVTFPTTLAFNMKLSSRLAAAAKCSTNVEITSECR